MLKIEKLNGETIYVVEGLSLDSADKVVNYGLKKKDLEEYVKRSQLSQLAQFYKLISEGLILSAHCFQGLRRNLHSDDHENGDKSKFVLVRKPSKDYSWIGGASGQPHQHIAPTKCVFVTLISKNEHHKGQYPTIEGWIDRWNWVEEDEGGLLEAPTKWIDRYDHKIWTRSA